MKKIVAIALLLLDQTAFAIQASSTNLNLGAGIFGSRGLSGVSVERFLTPNHTVSLAAGLDLIGMTGSLGYKYFTDTLTDKCMFFFNCSSHFYLGPQIQYAAKTRSEFSSEGTSRVYETESKLLGVLAVGHRDVFSSGITLDLEVTYRGIVSGGQSRLTSGEIRGSDLHLLEWGYRTVGIGIALGYLW